jgi:methionyl-tRNA formyltransferase
MKLRDLTEEHYFPDNRFHFQQNTESIHVTAKELNSDRIVEFICQDRPSVVFVFGVGVLQSKVLECLDGVPIINLHFGLSPYFRGSDTLLWPLYLQNPGCIGITLHQIDEKIDHGPIYHQQYTDFDESDTIHDVFCKTILQGKRPTLTLIDLLFNGVELEPIPTRQVGKMFYSGEFTPRHLKTVYDLVNDGMLKRYLANPECYGQPFISSVLGHRFRNYE